MNHCPFCSNSIPSNLSAVIDYVSYGCETCDDAAIGLSVLCPKCKNVFWRVGVSASQFDLKAFLDRFGFTTGDIGVNSGVDAHYGFVVKIDMHGHLIAEVDKKRVVCIVAPYFPPSVLIKAYRKFNIAWFKFYYPKRRWVHNVTWDKLIKSMDNLVELERLFNIHQSIYDAVLRQRIRLAYDAGIDKEVFIEQMVADGLIDCNLNRRAGIIKCSSAHH